MAKVIQLKEVVSEFDQPREMAAQERSGETPPMEQPRVPSTPPESDQQDKAVSGAEQLGEETGACSDTTIGITDTQSPVVDTEPATEGGKAFQDRKKQGKAPRTEAELQQELESCPQPSAASSNANSETGSHSRLVVHQAQEAKRGQTPKEVREKLNYKIFVIGKAGTGKSSLCNKIVRREVFPTGGSFRRVTTETKEAKTIRSGLDITMVDTPDISDANEDRRKEIVNSWKKLTEGFTYMVVLAVRCDQRYSPAEYAVYRQIRDLWGRDLCRRLVVAFTFADTREDPSVDMKEELKEVWPELKLVIGDAGGRYVLFNNKSENTDEKPMRELTDIMLKLVGEDGDGDGDEQWRKGAKICISALLVVPFVFVIIYLINKCASSPSCPYS